MKPEVEQALDMVDRAASLAPLARNEHARVIEALRLLRSALEPPKKEKKEK